MPECLTEFGPRSVVVGICPSSCLSRVIYPDIHGLFDVSWCSLWLPVNNGEAVWADWVSCGAAVLMDGRWGPEMFFEPVPKYSPRLSNVLLRTVYVWAFEFVDNLTLLKFVSLSLGATRSVLMVFVPLKCVCIP